MTTKFSKTIYGLHVSVIIINIYFRTT